MPPKRRSARKRAPARPHAQQPSVRLLDLLASPHGREALATLLPVVITTSAWLKLYERRYAATKNPVYALEALALVLGPEVDEPLPAWVKDYLRRVTTRMQKLSRTEIPAGEIAPAIARALEFPRGRRINPFRTLRDHAHDAQIAAEVSAQLEGGAKLDGVLATVAEQHPARCDRQPPCKRSRSTVARIWKRFQPR